MVIEGGGFIGGATDEVTLVELVAEFVPDNGGNNVSIDTILVPEFVDGRVVRYVMNEDDDLGRLLDMRYQRGTVTGQVKPIAVVQKRRLRR